MTDQFDHIFDTIPSPNPFRRVARRVHEAGYEPQSILRALHFAHDCLGDSDEDKLFSATVYTLLHGEKEASDEIEGRGNTMPYPVEPGSIDWTEYGE